MSYNELKNYLEEYSKDTKFKTKVGSSLGFVICSNSQEKEFTLSLSSILTGLNDIVSNHSNFISCTNYIESEWRNLSTYYSDITIQTMATVQTKPLFVTFSKFINWANSNPHINDNIINLDLVAIKNTIDKLEKIIDLLTPANEEKFDINLKDDRVYIERNVIRDFVYDVMSFLIKYDNLEKLLPYLTNLSGPFPTNSNLELDGNRLTTIFKVSNSILTNTSLMHSGILRFYEEPFEIDDKKFYLSTEWTNKTDSRLDLQNLKEIIEKLYPSLELINDNPFILKKKKFLHKNILFKGVPGTGKSFTINNLLKYNLNILGNSRNIIRINIHSASNNSDLMQGIGITSNDSGNIEYKEKQGLIYNQIKKAILNPFQSFALILEEIQENSLNELIGDLIYLIEDTKRIKISDIISQNINSFSNKLTYQEIITKLIDFGKEKHYIEIPYLIENRTDYRKMILPDNFYIFATSNYRDDKKVIEDNLLRRFDVIEIYPHYDSDETSSKNIYLDINVSNFLKKLNSEIIEHFKNSEIHPDRFVIGHANWYKVNTEKQFYRSLLKVVIEFKDIKDLDYENDFKKIFEKVDQFPSYITDIDLIKNKKNYKEIIEYLQKKSEFNFL